MKNEKNKNGKYLEHDASECWYKDGALHREEIDPKTGLSLPAVIDVDGAMFWYKDGALHRDEIDPNTGLSLPAAIRDNSMYWYKKGYCHRVEIDPKTGLTAPAVIDFDGTQRWYKDGKRHRVEIDPKTGLTAPAVIKLNGEKFWNKEGALHRIDGPAIIERNSHGVLVEHWFLDNVKIKKEEHFWFVAQKERQELDDAIKVKPPKRIDCVHLNDKQGLLKKDVESIQNKRFL